MKTLAYIRISTATQNTARQEAFFDNLEIPMCNRFTDKISGTTAKEDRKGLMTLLSKVNDGDFVHFEATDRISRNIVEGTKILETLTTLGANIVIGGKAYDHNDHDQEFIKGIELLLAQRMRKDMLKKQKAGIKAYKLNGGKFGQAPTEITAEFVSLNERRLNKELTHKDVIDQLRLLDQFKSESTYYRMVKKYNK